MLDPCVHCGKETKDGDPYSMIGLWIVCADCMTRLLNEMAEADAAMADEYDEEEFG